MAMYPCKNCYSNRWHFDFDDDTGYVVATCQQVGCGWVVRFMGKRQKKIAAGQQIGTNITAEFKKIDGKMCRKESDGLFYPVELIPVKGGLQLMANRFVKGIAGN